MMRKLVTGFVIGAIGSSTLWCDGFHSGHAGSRIGIRTRLSNRESLSTHLRFGEEGRRSITVNMSNQFDISKPVFDPLSLRNVRGDAIVRYDATNQSEPLRIILYALLGASFLSAPSIVEAIGYDSMNTPTAIACVTLAVGSWALFVRECSRRARQLRRIEKELNTESLPIRLPTNPFSEMPFSKAITLKTLRAMKTPPRIIALAGTGEKLTKTLTSLAIYRQRLSQASVFVVAVPTDGSTIGDCQALNKSLYKSWLADSYQPQVWLEYFRALTESDDDNNFEFRWFGLNSNGRSFGSGDTDMQIIQLMGQFLRPVDFLDVSDVDATKGISDSESANSEKELLEALETFYNALTEGDREAMESIFCQSNSKEVSEVIQLGGRIDSWKECLAEGARPSGMQTSKADVTVISETEAYTTCVEFPTNTGMDSASLLAMQKFTRVDATEPWKLYLHQTIPWSVEAKAQGTLQCDCRGCVALTRGRERRTFGGIIG